MDSSEPRANGGRDRRSILERLRDDLLTVIATSKDARALPAASKELRAVLAELDALPERGKVTGLDDARAEYRGLMAVADLPAQATGTG
jgi:hypothetical protein